MGGRNGAVRLGTRWEHRLWTDHYAGLAGWVLAVTGDRATAWEIADEAFCRVFTRFRPPHQRRILYAEALTLVNVWLEHRTSASPRSPDGGWLFAEVVDLSPRPRDCLLLHEAGLDTEAMAHVLRLGSRAEAEYALTLAFLQRAMRDTLDESAAQSPASLRTS